MKLSRSPALQGPEDVPLRILVPAFVTSELKSAFQIGCMLFIPFLIIDLVVSSVLMGYFIFDVPLRGNLFFLALSSGVFLFGALSWGILISAIAKTQLLAYQMGMLSSFLPAFLLSGFMYSIDNMPRPIQVVTHIVPARYFIAILKAVYLKGEGLALLWVQVLFLLAYAAIVFAVATRKIGQKVA